jgi:hypothetical protein
MNPYFSMTRIRQLEPEIQALVNKLCDRLKAFKNTGFPIVAQHAYTCFATDVISDYNMGVGFHYPDDPGFMPQWSETLSGFAKSSVFLKHFSWLGSLQKALPEGLVARFHPGMDFVFKFQHRCGLLLNSGIEAQNSKGEKKKFAHPLSSTTCWTVICLQKRKVPRD